MSQTDYVSATREAAFFGPGKFRGVTRKAPKSGTMQAIN